MLCTWNVDGHNYEGVGQNKDMAKATAALNALSKLKISTERNWALYAFELQGTVVSMLSLVV